MKVISTSKQTGPQAAIDAMDKESVRMFMAGESNDPEQQLVRREEDAADEWEAFVSYS